ncbi:MAG: type II toxin-antitoxin system VapC family toxin [Euzebya sp.]
MMQFGPALLDTAIFIYAVGGHSPYRAACRRLLSPDVLPAYSGQASVQAIQELLHQRTRRTGDRQESAQVAVAASKLCPLHELTERDLRLSLELFAQHESLTGRDALHAATAIVRDIPVIISPDGDFDGIVGLQRVDPLEAAATI